MNCSRDEHELDQRCCKKCPKGTHVSSHCPQKSAETRCEACAQGYYTESSNYIDNCLPCRSCDATHHLQISKPCTKESNSKCRCMEGYYCTPASGNSEDHCEKCESVSRCPPGYGVSVPPNSTHDTVCEPCPPGTFNKNNDYTPCHNRTSCSDLGRHYISHGTAEADAQCGDFMSRCHWMIPASLWAGLILTIILVIIGAVCLKSRRRRKAVITSVSSENFVPPALPPDVIKYPRNSELQTLNQNNELRAGEDDGALEYDGVSVNIFMEKCGAFSIPDTCMSFISEPYRSEPQEDDWPGL